MNKQLWTLALFPTSYLYFLDMHRSLNENDNHQRKPQTRLKWIQFAPKLQILRKPYVAASEIYFCNWVVDKRRLASKFAGWIVAVMTTNCFYLMNVQSFDVWTVSNRLKLTKLSMGADITSRVFKIKSCFEPLVQRVQTSVHFPRTASIIL